MARLSRVELVCQYCYSFDTRVNVYDQGFSLRWYAEQKMGHAETPQANPG